MKLAGISPFRQLARGYGALIGLNENMAKISSSIESLAEVAKRTVPPEPPSHDVSIYTVNGFRLLLDRSSLVDRLVIEEGEGERVRYLMTLAENFRNRRTPIFLDLGAYWGYYSFMMYSTGVFERIYAFDADAYNFAQLQANIFLNKLDGIMTAEHAAVSDTPGVLSIQNSRSHADGNRGATRVLREDEDIATGQVRNVRSIAIDDVLDIEGAHIVIKMDVEAHEDRALMGLRRTIARNKVFIQVEIYREQTQTVVPALESLGLRRISAMYPDFFYTNIPEEELGY